jgi:5S rRNA maturation endonuclease (ribonuclease M5)
MGSMTGRDWMLDEFLASLTDCTVMVEGKKDAQALSALGVDPESIVILNKGQSMLATIEALAGSVDVVVLTDMDGGGRRLYRTLITMFSQYGIIEDKRPRELFARLRLSQVEGLRI